MASYISSNANRFYTALESSYGNAAPIQAQNRIPALKLIVRHQLEVTQRRDKTGSRTFPGLPTGGRRRTDFELHTYLTSWQNTTGGPSYGPLFQAALGGSPLASIGGTVNSSDSTGRLTFSAPHGLNAGQAVASGGQIRFATAIVDPNTVQLNAPFVTPLTNNTPVTPTMTYTLSTELPSVSVYDYWSPTAAVQRILCGAAIDQMDIVVNGDYHEFHFIGIAQDVVDSSSFSAGAAQLQNFPVEPLVGGFDYSIVPGNLGEAWLGTSPAQFFTITSASIQLKNTLATRHREFGFNVPRAISPGERSVTATFQLHELDDTATASLYQAARQQSPITVMFQLGNVQGQVMAVNLKSVIPTVPEFDDSQNRLQWRFRSSRAQGTVDDELVIAFG
jgi:hypothetical protein